MKKCLIFVFRMLVKEGRSSPKKRRRQRARRTTKRQPKKVGGSRKWWGVRQCSAHSLRALSLLCLMFLKCLRINMDPVLMYFSLLVWCVFSSRSFKNQIIYSLLLLPRFIIKRQIKFFVSPKLSIVLLSNLCLSLFD
jgi:hypothetical protein